MSSNLTLPKFLTDSKSKQHYPQFYDRVVLVLLLHTAPNQLLNIDPERLARCFLQNAHRCDQYQLAVLDHLWETTIRGSGMTISRDYKISRFTLWGKHQQLFRPVLDNLKVSACGINDAGFEAFRNLCRRGNLTYQAWLDEGHTVEAWMYEEHSTYFALSYEMSQALPVLYAGLPHWCDITTMHSQHITLLGRGRISDEQAVAVKWREFSKRLYWLPPHDWIIIGLSFAAAAADVKMGIGALDPSFRFDLYQQVIGQWNPQKGVNQLLVLTTAIALLGPVFPQSSTAMAPSHFLATRDESTPQLVATLLLAHSTFVTAHPALSDHVVSFSMDIRAPFEKLLFGNDKDGLWNAHWNEVIKLVEETGTEQIILKLQKRSPWAPLHKTTRGCVSRILHAVSRRPYRTSLPSFGSRVYAGSTKVVSPKLDC